MRGATTQQERARERKKEKEQVQNEIFGSVTKTPYLCCKITVDTAVLANENI